jgi:hypothetical protein
MTNIKIHAVYPGTEKQVAKGIHGTVNLNIVDDNDVIVTSLSGIMIRKNGQTGDYFLAAPSYTAGNDDQGKPRYRNHYRLFPLGSDDEMNARQKERMAELTREVVRTLQEQSSKGTPSTPPKTTSTAW